MTSAKEDLRPTEVAALLKVSRATVHRWTTQGVLRPSRTFPSGHRRYALADVRALQERLDNKQGPIPADPRLTPEELATKWWKQPPARFEDIGKCPCPRLLKKWDCDHIWCLTCREWNNDTGNGVSCTHQPTNIDCLYDCGCAGCEHPESADSRWPISKSGTVNRSLATLLDLDVEELEVYAARCRDH